MEKIFTMKKINEEDTKKINEEGRKKKNKEEEEYALSETSPCMQTAV